MGLSETFLHYLPPEARPVDTDGLEERLQAFVARGANAWPSLPCEPTQLVGYVAQRFGPDQTLEGTHAEGLFIAWACVTGSDQAVALFRDHYGPVMQSVFRRLGFHRFAEEIMQRVLRSIFVYDGKSGPALLGFNGRGSLSNWVRVLTVREAYRVTRQQKRRDEREVGSPDERLMNHAVSEGANPELLHLKREYRTKFKQSFQSAFDRLSHRERNVLRYQYLDGLNLEQIGAVYAVSRATVARWRARARARLLAETRKIMRDEHRVPLEEFDGALHLIQSALDVSLSRLLTAVAREGEPADQRQG